MSPEFDEEVTMLPANWTCCTEGQDLPWWAWLIVAIAVLACLLPGAITWWLKRKRRQADADGPEEAVEPGAATYPEIWAQVMVDRPNGPARPGEVPVPESVEDVTAWAGKEDSRRVELIYAPVFWVVLPIAALGGMIWGSIADPRDGWTGTFFPVENNEPPWNFGLGWAAVTVWLLIMVGVLLIRLSVFRGLRAENRWVFEHGVPYSIHRSSVDYDDGEASGWPTYIALDHHLDFRQAARIFGAFETWLRGTGLPPSGSGPISSEVLFGPQAKGGYFILHLPVSQTAGVTAAHEWMLITEPQDSDDEVIVTPVPVGKQFTKTRGRARRKAARQARPERPDPQPPTSTMTSTELVRWEP